MRAFTSFFACLALALCAGPALSKSPVPEGLPDAKIVLRDDLSDRPDAVHAWLIPIRLLETPYASWSPEDRELVSPETLARFDKSVESWRKATREPKCGFIISCFAGGDSDSSTNRRPSLFRMAGDRKSVLLGEILGSEPAWDTGYGHIYTLFHLKVHEVLRQMDSIGVGDIVTFGRFGGSVTVRGTNLCTFEDYRDPTPPEPNSSWSAGNALQKVLVMGNIARANTTYLDSLESDVFPVVGDKVLYPSGIDFYEGLKPESLEEVISYFSGISK